MWLLNCHTYELEFHIGEDIPFYAILSHVWGKEEVTFQEITQRAGRDKAGWLKVRDCCKQAVKDSLDYCWIDTCCIDKTSSAELQEAINSALCPY